MKFSELNLHPDLEKALTEAGYIDCMPVQEQVFRSAFSGQDLYVQSQTGTGKTAAFLVVIFQRLLSEPMLQGKKAIIMVPTRELAVQVEEEAKVIGKHLSFKIGSFFGGVGYTQQSKLLRDNVRIMIGTPGRVLDLNQSGKMNLMEIAFLVLDEADRMFDMGFYPDLRKLIRAVPPVDRRQTMLFSATLNAWVKNLAWEYTRNPFEIAIEPEMVTVEEVEQVLYHVSSADKMKLLLGILKREDPESAIIFCNTKQYTEIVAKRLRLNGIDCEFIMGDLPQPKRLKIIEDIKSGKLRYLVATDVAARGLDIEDLALVINYDLPNETENYVHRIGRTARAGKTGKAITLASEQDVYELPKIERFVGGKIPSETAAPELLSEDKTEGKRIQTDRYDDRPGNRGKDTEKPGRKDRLKSKSSRKDPRDRKPRLKTDQEAEVGRPTGQTTDENLSNLSFDERMAYYRQKYDKSSPRTSTPGDGARGDNRRDKNKGRKRRDRSGKKAPNAGQAARAPAPGTPEAPAAANPATPAPEPTTPKKGILSKLLGIFGKK
ncbi:MAG: DEAD/DEAH box helicase [Treponema sp.]|nr:DEAD/DEAH box helicase [Treponema sp.]